VVAALLLSTFSVTLSVAAFTMLCWKVGADLGDLPDLPLFHGSFGRRLAWLLLSAGAILFAKLIDACVSGWKSSDGINKSSYSADELPAGTLDCFVVAPE
jgi:hypothetical protein